MDVSDINPINSSFKLTLRIFGTRRVNLQELGFSSLSERVLANDGCLPLEQEDIHDLTAKVVLPHLCVWNANSEEELDPVCVRINGGSMNNTYVMWNRAAIFTCSQRFHLRNFPYDHQDLVISLGMRDSIDWNNFKLMINVISISCDVVDQTEWGFNIPYLDDYQTSDRREVIFQAKRFSAFYTRNVIGMMVLLSTLGLTAFAMDISDIGSRISTILTLLLTSVAFKLILSDSLPKVPYNTLIDYYLLASTLHLGAMALCCLIPDQINEDQSEYINTILALMNLGIVFFILICWSFSVYIFTRHQLTREPIPSFGKEPFINFRFSTPPFMHYIKN